MFTHGVSTATPVLACLIGVLWPAAQHQAHAFVFVTRTPSLLPPSPSMTAMEATSRRGSSSASHSERNIFRCRLGDSALCRRRGGRRQDGVGLLSAAAAEAARGRMVTRLQASNGGKNTKDNEEEPYFIPGSGMRGLDTSQMSGTERRDADWFERTAGRESRGELQWFENPVTYAISFVAVTGLVFVWAIFACFIPGYCAPN
ncbi:unnamed protein product [Sphacelaria rigidula]